jgi:hypothetical protein
MWRYSGAGTMFLMVATSVAASWPGLVRGHRRPVGEFASFFGAPPSVVPPRLQSEYAQDDGHGKEGFGAGDGAKDSSFSQAFGEALPGETEPGSTEQGE